jgi:hypothetical protein
LEIRDWHFAVSHQLRLVFSMLFGKLKKKGISVQVSYAAFHDR